MIFNDWLKTATQQVGVNNAKVEGKRKKNCQECRRMIQLADETFPQLSAQPHTHRDTKCDLSNESDWCAFSAKGKPSLSVSPKETRTDCGGFHSGSGGTETVASPAFGTRAHRACGRLSMGRQQTRHHTVGCTNGSRRDYAQRPSQGQRRGDFFSSCTSSSPFGVPRVANRPRQSRNPRHFSDPHKQATRFFLGGCVSEEEVDIL